MAKHRAIGLSSIVALPLAALPFSACSDYDDAAFPAEARGTGRDASAADGAFDARSAGGFGGDASGRAGTRGRDGSAGKGGANEAGSDRASRVDSGATKDAMRAAIVLINELNANISKSCDLVELRVVAAGTMAGFELWARTTPLIGFSDFVVKPNDIIVVHLNNAECSPNGKNETLSATQNSDPTAYAAAFDWYSTTQGMVSTDLVLTLYDANGVMLDAALFSDDPTGTAAAASEQQASIVAAAGQWEMSGGGVPSGGFVDDGFNANAVQDLNACSTTPEGTSLARSNDDDSNQKTDWSQGPASWGQLNTGQNPQP